MVGKRIVNVLQFPAHITPADYEAMERDVESGIYQGHRCFVLNCAGIESFSRAEIKFLLICLETVMKHNADIRLAAVSNAARQVLRKYGLTRIFEIHQTVDSAIISYHVQPYSMVPLYEEIATVVENKEFVA